MTELARTRDTVILVKGDCLTVSVTDALAQSGWIGGQGMQWASNTLKDELTVKSSDGYYAGFALWGSSEISDQYTAITDSQTRYKYITIGAGGWLIATKAYEQFTYQSRQSGPLVPISYSVGDRLIWSLRGYWTTQDEWTITSDPRAPNTYYLGFVAQAPIGGYLGIQVSI